MPPGDPALAGQHLLCFYEDVRELARTVARRIADTLRLGGMAVAAAPARRLDAIEAALGDTRVNIEAAFAEGSYLSFDSELTTRQVMVDGELDWDRIDVALWEIIGPKPGSWTCRFAYGEISPLLWENGMIDAALRVEARADELVAQTDVTLLCGYQRSLFTPDDLDAVRQLCQHHNYLISLPFAP
jgi:hypothetical protein